MLACENFWIVELFPLRMHSRKNTGETRTINDSLNESGQDSGTLRQ